MTVNSLKNLKIGPFRIKADYRHDILHDCSGGW